MLNSSASELKGAGVRVVTDDAPLEAVRGIFAVRGTGSHESSRTFACAPTERPAPSLDADPLTKVHPELLLRGSSRAMTRVFDVVARVAPSDASVLICGETGTGKELIARAIHNLSRHREGPFVALNCAAVHPNLLESELFGHAKGAFTDAKVARPGLFKQASGGTLFLDELGEMPIEMQERKVRPVGSDEEVEFDARIVSATNRDLEEEVVRKRFREDLYYRINVVKIELPPLRERATDVLELAHHFLEVAAMRDGHTAVRRLSGPAAERLMQYNWPGNVRELENSLERAVAMCCDDEIALEDLPDRLRKYRSEALPVAAQTSEEVVTLDELERRYIDRVLKIVSGNKSRAAELLGLDRRTLYRKLARSSSPGAELSM